MAYLIFDGVAVNKKIINVKWLIDLELIKDIDTVPLVS